MENTLNENGYQIGLNKSFKSKLHDQLYFWYFTHKENFKLLSLLKSKKQNKPHLSGRSNIAVNYCEGIDKDKVKLVKGLVQDARHDCEYCASNVFGE